MDLTTVSDHHAVVHDGSIVHRRVDLEPDTTFELAPAARSHVRRETSQIGASHLVRVGPRTV